MTFAPLAIEGRSQPIESAGARNMRQLVQLRWFAVIGQLATVLGAHLAGIALPLVAMITVMLALVALNIVTLLLLRTDRFASHHALFFALILDVLSLTVQLYLSGGATNPFISLYLLQVVLGAILLDRWPTLVVAGVATGCFALLAIFYQPLALPPLLAANRQLLDIVGAWVNFVLVAGLLILFIARITGNLRTRDARLADLRQHAAEEDHIVRMGLLASGAAHELGTPLASLAVILGDWKRMPMLADDPDLAAEIDEMQREVLRCKTIVTGVLMAAGEARGEAPAVTTMNAFLNEIVADWRALNPATILDHHSRFGADVPVIADPALKQVIFNVLDNAREVSPERISFTVTREGDAALIAVRDSGPGFAPDHLAELGRPYRSTKGRPGSGLGLFLVVNVMRKLGGSVVATNDPRGGAVVTLTLPLAVLAIGDTAHDD